MIRTARLILRPWRPEDADPFAAIGADPEVMAFFPAPYTRAESEANLARYTDHLTAHGFTRWAVEAPGIAPLIGHVGLLWSGADLPFPPRPEFGWRLARAHWGQGFATEAARAVIADAFTRCGLGEVVAYTAARNAPSRAVMRRLGMAHDPAEDFDHPAVPEGHALRPHVLYRLAAPAKD